MDGLLIDSEPLWQQTEVEVLRPYGIPLTREMCTRTVGLCVPEAVKYWQERFPWNGPGLEVVVEEIVEGVRGLIMQQATPMPGAHEAIAACRDAGLALALATSSRCMLAELALSKLALADEFDHVLCAGKDSLGKPHPEVFLRAAVALDIEPQRCLVFEDSLNGVIAAKAASMRVAAIPGEHWADDPRFVLADYRLGSLLGVTPEWLHNLEVQ